MKLCIRRNLGQLHTYNPKLWGWDYTQKTCTTTPMHYLKIRIPSIKGIDLQNTFSIWSAITYLGKHFYPLEVFLVIQGSWVTRGYFNWSNSTFFGSNNSKIIFLKRTIACNFNQSKKRTLKPISTVDWLLAFSFTFFMFIEWLFPLWTSLRTTLLWDYTLLTWVYQNT